MKHKYCKECKSDISDSTLNFCPDCIKSGKASRNVLRGEENSKTREQQLTEAISLLKGMEWEGDIQGYKICPTCKGIDPADSTDHFAPENRDHRGNCRLRRFLDEVEK